MHSAINACRRCVIICITSWWFHKGISAQASMTRSIVIDLCWRSNFVCYSIWLKNVLGIFIAFAGFSAFLWVRHVVALCNMLHLLTVVSMWPQVKSNAQQIKHHPEPSVGDSSPPQRHVEFWTSVPVATPGQLWTSIHHLDTDCGTKWFRFNSKFDQLYTIALLTKFIYLFSISK